jgi:DNA-binding NarL/FixJ family response regulator
MTIDSTSISELPPTQERAVARTLVGSDSPILLDHLRSLIAQWAGFELVDAVPGAELVSSLEALKPDIALVGPIGERGPHEAEILSRTQGQVRVVFMSADPEPSIYDAVALGAAGYLTMAADAQELREVLDAATLDRARFSAAAQEVLAEEVRVRGRAERPSVTKREQQILQLMGEGLSSAEIGDRLGVTKSTVKSHVHNLFKKFGVNSRSQAVAAALRYKMI